MRSARGLLVLTPCAVLAAAALIGAAAPPDTAPGVTYTIHSNSVPTGDGPMRTAMEAQRSAWTGAGAFAAGRGRMDLVEGSIATMMATGDYMLYDSTGLVVVRPATKTFFSLPSDIGNRAMAMTQASGMKMVIKDVTVSLDSLGAGDPLGGHQTSHYRMSASYTLIMDLSGLGVDLGDAAPPPITTTMSAEYWFADGSGALLLPFHGMSTGSVTKAGSPLPEISDKMVAALARLPKDRIMLKTVTSTRMSGGPDISGATETTMEVTDTKKADVDLARLVLPDGYTETGMPGMGALGAGSTLSKDGGAKWRVRPGRTASR